MAQNQDRPMRKKVADFLRQAPRRYPVFSVALGILIIVLIIWFLPYWQVPASGLSLKDRLHQINENRKTVAQIVGGVFILVGLYIAWVRSEAAKKMAEGDKERRITDLYVKAIEQLGSDNIHIRLGGIYALERIARESPKDHWPIMEVLTAFVRENAPLRKEAQTAPEAAEEDAPHTGPPTSPEKPPTDIQAVLTVLGRTAIDYAQKGEERALDLRATHLAGADLHQANLKNVSLEETNLQKAHIAKANLQGADLTEANLQGALLAKTNLQWGVLSKARLQGAGFFIANLQGADLKKANLQGAVLAGTNLRGADLREAKGLTIEKMAKAAWDETTQWPEGFSPPTPRQENDVKNE